MADRRDARRTSTGLFGCPFVGNHEGTSVKVRASQEGFSSRIVQASATPWSRSTGTVGLPARRWYVRCRSPVIRLYPPQSWAAAVLDGAGRPVGLGVLVQHNRLVTCTHVVARALGVDAERCSPPTGTLTVQAIASRERIAADVVVWHAVDPTFANPLQDICMLRIAESSLALATFDELVSQEPRRKNGVKVFGYPNIAPPGRFSYGHVLSDMVDNGWWQLDPPESPSSGHTPLGPGFSGSLAWDEAEDKAVGLVVVRDGMTFVIPSALLREACEPTSVPEQGDHARTAEGPSSRADANRTVPIAQPHDVFLCHSGHDKPLVRALARALRARNLRVWLDEWEIPPGAPWQEALERAIQTVRSAAVLYGPSGIGPWADREMRAILSQFTRRKLPVIPVLLPGVSMTPELPLFLNEFTWSDLRSGLSREDIDRLVWGITGERQDSEALPAADTQEDFARLVWRAGEHVDFADDSKLAGSLFKLWNVPQLPSEYRARAEVQQLKLSLLSNDTQPLALTGSSKRFALQGMGGVGKTTLASALARDGDVRRAFPDGVFWLTLGQSPESPMLLQARLAAALGSSAGAPTNVEAGRAILREAFAKRACLLVLDDVWDADDVEPFNELGERSRLLVTTRKEDVGRGIAAVPARLAELTDGDARELFARYVGTSTESLFPEATSIIAECGELPLALAMVGSLLRDRPQTSWATLLKRLRSADIGRLAAKLPGYPHRSLLAAIDISVADLPHELRDRYLDLAVFPEDTAIPEAVLKVYWGPQGLDEATTQDVSDAFVDRGLARRDSKGRLTLHDLQHDYIRASVPDLTPLHARLLEAYRRSAPAGLHTGPNDGYFYQAILHHLFCVEGRDAIRKLLFDYRWLAAKLAATEPNAVLVDFETIDLANDRPARLLSGALRLSAHVLERHPSELGAQLIGRLIAAKCPELCQLVEQARTAITLRGFVPILPALTAPGGPLLRTFEGHPGWVKSVALSVDQKFALSGSYDFDRGRAELKLWDVGSGKLRRTFAQDSYNVSPVAFKSDGKIAAFGVGYNGFSIFDLSTDKLLRTFAGTFSAVVLGGDQEVALAGSHDGTLGLWNVSSGELLRTFTGHGDRITSIAVSDDQRMALSGSADKTLKLWDIVSGELVRTFDGHQNWVTSVAISRDQKLALSGSTDKTLKLWDVFSGELLRTLEGHQDWVTSVALSGDGNLALSGAEDKTLRLWDVRAGTLVRLFDGHQGMVTSVVLSDDGKLGLSGSNDKTFKLWEVDSDAAPQNLEEHHGNVTSVVLSTDQKLVLSSSNDKSLKLRDIASGTLLRTFEGHQGMVTSAVLSSDEKLALSASSDKTLKLWDVASGTLIRTFEGDQDWVTAVAMSPDQKLALSASSNRTLKLWDLESGALLRTLDAHRNWVTSVAFSSDGKLALSGSYDETLKLWDVDTGTVLRSFEGHHNWVSSVAISADGKLAISGSHDKTLKLWELATGSLLRTFTGHQGRVISVALSGDQKLALSGGSENTLKIWDITREGPALATFTGDASFDAVALSHDGKIAIAGDGLGRVHAFEVRY